MSNPCSNTLRLIGSRQALTDALVQLSQGSDFNFVELGHGSGRFAADVTYKGPAGVESRLQRADTLSPNLLVHSPLRYQGFGSEGWYAPRAMERVCSYVTVTDAEVPEELLDGAVSAEEQLGVLRLFFDTKNSPPLRLLEELSRRLPWLVVETHYVEAGNGLYGARAWRAGVSIAAAHIEPTATRESLGLDEEDDSGESDGQVYDARLDDFNLQVSDLVTQPAYEHALTALAPYPKWDELTAAAHSKSDRLLETLSRHGDPLAVLRASLDAARAAGRCSWLDLAVSENDEVEELFDEAFVAPGDESDHDVALFPFTLSGERLRALLEACAAEGQHKEVADAVHTVLADPGTRLAGGEHPIGILIQATKSEASPLALAGLRRVVDAFAAAVPRLPDAELLGREFLAHKIEGGNSDDAIANLLAGAVADLALPKSLSEGPLAQIIGRVRRSERGPALNPHYRFDAEADHLLRSALHAGLQCTVEGFRVAAAAGIEEGFLFRTMCFQDPISAFDVLRSIRGTVLDWPADYVRDLEAACRRIGNTTALMQYHALATEERMKIVIDGVPRGDRAMPAVQRQRKPL